MVSLYIVVVAWLSVCLYKYCSGICIYCSVYW